MIDMEKVVNGLRCIKGDLILCVDCAYSDGNGHGTYSCKAFCANDAIELLKEQDYRKWPMDMFHKYERDDLIALLVQYGEENLLKTVLKEQEAKPLRCKTCTMRDKTGFCHRWNIEVKDNDYCSFGAWKGC